MSDTPWTDPAIRKELAGKLMSVAVQIMNVGGPGALAGCVLVLTEEVTAALPASHLVEFVTQLLDAIQSGAKTAGSEVSIDVDTPLPERGALH